jgi:hypothetical protein
MGSKVQVLNLHLPSLCPLYFKFLYMTSSNVDEQFYVLGIVHLIGIESKESDQEKCASNMQA